MLLLDSVPWETCLFKQEEVWAAGRAPRPVFSQKTLFSCQRHLHHWHFNKDFVGVGARCGWDDLAAGGRVFDEGALLTCGKCAVHSESVRAEAHCCGGSVLQHLSFEMWVLFDGGVSFTSHAHWRERDRIMHTKRQTAFISCGLHQGKVKKWSHLYLIGN